MSKRQARHLSIALLEQWLSTSTEPAYVEVGRYKPYSAATVNAAARRGYRVERLVRNVYHIYPKQEVK